MTGYEEELKKAVWVAHSLFDRGKTSGSSANISILLDGEIYISASGTCFGTLKEEDFAIVSIEDGKNKNDKKPSKELPLHKIFYEKNPAVKAIVHTHSFYSVLMSCLEPDENGILIPKYTPYLEMKVGEIKTVPYAPPGSPALFEAFTRSASSEIKGYLLKNHGLLVGDKDIMSAFYGAEEMEESARVAWYLRNSDAKTIQ